MSNTSASTVAQRSTRAARRFTSRPAVAAAAGLTLFLVASAAAQTVTPAAATGESEVAGTPRAHRFEFRVSSGALVATGDQRNAIKDAELSAAQLSWLVRPNLAVTGTFGWARSRDRVLTGTPKLDVFTSDLGIEARPAPWSIGSMMTFSPFAGVGAGMRSYNYRKLDVNATHNVAGYGAVGGEVGMGRVGLRIEVRDYATGFRPLTGTGKRATRNDIAMTAALRFQWHRTAEK